MRRVVIAGVVVVVAVVAALAVIGLVRGLPEDTSDEPQATGESGPDGLAEFYTQELSWEDCGEGRCTRVEVPVDYAEPDGATTELAVKRIPADGDGDRRLFVNPGGPGGSAIEFADYLVTLLGDEVRETYDVVGVDPRGVGESTPLACLPDERFDAFVAADPTPDDEAELTRLRELTTELGEACRAEGGELAAHVSTEEAARDMDVVRALLGAESFDWFGASYGTQLGATYATVFPETVGRMVLDGAVDPSLDGAEAALGQATGFQRALEAYVEDCVADDECPLGSDPREAIERIDGLLSDLDADPLVVGERELTEGLAFYGIAVTLYDRATWPVLTQGLRSALDDDGSVLLQLSDLYFQRGPDGGYPSNIGEVIYAVSCLDVDGEEPTISQVRDRVEEFTDVSPVFGPALAWGTLACADWPIEATSPQVEIDAEGAGPILVVGTTRDPATPYEWSEALAEQLASGVLLTREGDGHTAYGSGNDCIDDAVDGYLVDGTVPDDGTVCPE